MDTQDEKSLIEITNRRKIKKNKEKYKHMHATKLCIPFLTLNTSLFDYSFIYNHLFRLQMNCRIFNNNYRDLNHYQTLRTQQRLHIVSDLFEYFSLLLVKYIQIVKMRKPRTYIRVLCILQKAKIMGNNDSCC